VYLEVRQQVAVYLEARQQVVRQEAMYLEVRQQVVRQEVVLELPLTFADRTGRMTSYWFPFG
jgi:hypothetical protein